MLKESIEDVVYTLKDKYTCQNEKKMDKSELSVLMKRMV